MKYLALVALTACSYKGYIPTDPSLPAYTVQALASAPSQANAGSATAVVGWAGGVHHAVTFAGGSATPLAEPAGAVSSEARGVNDAGIIVGVATLGGGVNEAVLWSSPTAAPMVLPGVGGSFAVANGINNNNTVVGVAQTDTGDTVLVLWQPNGASYTASAWDSAGTVTNGPAAITDNGDLAANAAGGGAIFWDVEDSFNGVSAPSGTTTANGLNSYGILVGGTSTGQAYAYTVTNSLATMGGPPSGYTSVTANAITNTGIVAGTATSSSASAAVIGAIANLSAPFVALPTLGGAFSAVANNGTTPCGVILGSATNVAVAWIPKGCSLP